MQGTIGKDRINRKKSELTDFRHWYTLNMFMEIEEI